MPALRLGFVGGGFITAFHLRACRQVRGVEVVGLCSRRPPEALAAYVREHGLGEGRIFASARAMVPHVDAVVICAPNFARLAVLREILAAVQAGARLRGVLCEKPLARNLAEAREMEALLRQCGVPGAYLENQLHMNAVQAIKAQLAPVIARMGPPSLVRAAEEHGGPHNAWFWDPRQQGGGVLSDMACHSIAVAWWLLTPPGEGPRFLEPIAVSADVALLKWGQPRWRDELRRRFGVDYAQTPAEDFATGVITFRNPKSGQSVKGQITTSWMYEKQGLRLSLDGMGPGYGFEHNTLRSGLELFVGDAAAAPLADAELALEKATATRGLLAVQPNEPDLYGYTDQLADAVAAFATGRPPLVGWDYGAEIVRLCMAAYLSAERRCVVDLTHPKTAAELEGYVPLIQQGRGEEVLTCR